MNLWQDAGHEDPRRLWVVMGGGFLGKLGIMIPSVSWPWAV